ncbi:hypothetical protein KO02_21660 [Sphingobacterium sp. ML3W]|uniref:hypothetical protein n=1 Tax=Sphingobacterium sp. ML3W TaxID=1538644 RepID=UPI0004F616A2|nr:hypothetical protein [Sphingobacterium sp. ML3W]AIM39009.1 hypothetical protein KO02_21660 [Sphingobacterium sp. ML3W]
MNTIKIYISSVWAKVQKLFKSGGEGFLLVGKVLVVAAIITVNIHSVRAQSKVEVKPVKLLDLPEIKPYEPLPYVVQDMPLELQYFNGDNNKTSTFREMNKNYVQLFFWDASYPEHYTDLKRIYDYREAMGRHSNVILVISKTDKATLEKVKLTLERFKKEFDVKMDIACIIGNPNLDKLFRVGAFPKYAQVNKDAVYYSEMSVDAMFKSF